MHDSKNFISIPYIKVLIKSRIDSFQNGHHAPLILLPKQGRMQVVKIWGAEDLN